MKLDTEPQPLRQVNEGSVTGVASILEAGYHELEEDYVLSFAKQGGVYHTAKGVHYPHLKTDFNNKKIQRKYNFPSKLDKLIDRFKINRVLNAAFIKSFLGLAIRLTPLQIKKLVQRHT